MDTPPTGGCARNQSTTQFCAEAADFAKKLAAVQADCDAYSARVMELRDIIEALREDACELLSERHWWKDESRGDYQKLYEETAENIRRADEALGLTR